MCRSEENNNTSNLQIRTLSFHCVAKNIEGWLEISILFLAYSHIWLNLVTHDSHFFYIVPYPVWGPTKFLKKALLRRCMQVASLASLLRRVLQTKSETYVVEIGLSQSSLSSPTDMAFSKVQLYHWGKKTWVLQSNTKALHIIQVWHKSNELKNIIKIQRTIGTWKGSLLYRCTDMSGSEPDHKREFTKLKSAPRALHWESSLK